MKSMKVVGRGALGLWSLLAVLGCGGVTQELGDIEGSSGGTAGTGGKASNAGGQPSNAAGQPSNAAGQPSNGPLSVCETPCVQAIFTKDVADCKLCHSSPGGLTSSGLDLQSPNVTARLKDVPAKHADISPPGSFPNCPVGDKLIDSANPTESWLLKKIRGEQGPCGTQMPQPPTTLTLTERACVETYVFCVAAQ